MRGAWNLNSLGISITYRGIAKWSLHIGNHLICDDFAQNMNYLEVEEISSRDGLGRITDCIWEVMEKTDGAHKVFFPVLGDRETALTECKDRLWREHENDPTSHWIFVRDASSKTLRVLGLVNGAFMSKIPSP